MTLNSVSHYDFVIIGGGIAGVVCAETLCELLNLSEYSRASVLQADHLKRVALVSATETVKTTINLQRITNMIESFDVEEKSGSSWSETWPNTITVIHDILLKLDPFGHVIYLQKSGINNPISYGKLCLTTGGVPRLIDPKHPYVIGLRDTESIETFQNRLQGTRRLMLVGNGGIATEIAHEVSGCQIIWVIKDSSISAPFLDPVAAAFLLEAREISKQGNSEEKGGSASNLPGVASEVTQIRRMRYVVAGNDSVEDISETSKGHLILVPVQNQPLESHISKPQVTGAALGPDWAHGRNLLGRLTNTVDGGLLKVVYQAKIKTLLSPEEFLGKKRSETLPLPNGNITDNGSVIPVDDWPVYVELTNNEIYGCDLVVSAIGVEANFSPFNKNNRGDTDTDASAHKNSGNDDNEADTTKSLVFGCSFDRVSMRLGGGLLIDEQMRTSCKDVYAAGDCAYAHWTWSPHWFQMRLWNQARQMGFHAAKCMFCHTNGDTNVPLDFSFELFTHVTYFFGFKVVLLGRFNGQGMNLSDPDTYILMRVTRGREFIKCIMQSGRMHGAVLIGETDLEETLENLILNQIDLTNLEDHLLDPDVDLSDYFD
uniref:Amine oxidase n=1 Tax=Trichobilharzia regenti TaxID=157069 RepID=A0AA85KEU2_TRIRE|nr:unnamed protein product [Trichobilharzia regenti]